MATQRLLRHINYIAEALPLSFNVGYTSEFIAGGRKRTEFMHVQYKTLTIEVYAFWPECIQNDKHKIQLPSLHHNSMFVGAPFKVW